MSNKGHEQAPVPELQEVKLDEINEQDMVVLETDRGSMYTLTVVETRHGRPLVVMDRQSDHSVRAGEHPVDLDDSLKFSLLGSCQGLLSASDGEELAPAGSIDKLVMVGKRVWLQSEAGEPLVTSPVASIAWVKADGE